MNNVVRGRYQIVGNKKIQSLKKIARIEIDVYYTYFLPMLDTIPTHLEYEAYNTLYRPLPLYRPLILYFSKKSEAK